VSITTPLLVMHSETDLRCAIEQAEHIFMTLACWGKGGRARALPGREPRADALGIARPSRDALRDPARLVRPLSEDGLIGLFRGAAAWTTAARSQSRHLGRELHLRFVPTEGEYCSDRNDRDDRRGHGH